MQLCRRIWTSDRVFVSSNVHSVRAWVVLVDDCMDMYELGFDILLLFSLRLMMCQKNVDMC